MPKQQSRTFMMGLMAVVVQTRGTPASAQTATSPSLEARIVDSVQPHGADGATAGPRGPVRADEFNMVGQYDVDWLMEAPLQRLLDNMAASPLAFGSVRFFHATD